MAYPRHALLGIALVVLAGRAAGVPAARAQDAPPAVAPPEDHQAQEVKDLVALLRSAVKEDFRRQAWWIAGRLLVASPRHREAEGVRAGWKGDDLALGRAPTKSWEQGRDAVLARLADAWVRHALEERAAGVPVADLAPFFERAFAYGSASPDARDALAQAGLAWAGGWGIVPREELEKALGAAREQVTFPPGCDDRALEVCAPWPEARVAQAGEWRLFSAAPAPEAARLLALLDAQERDFVLRFGSKAKARKPGAPWAGTDLVLAPDASVYDRLAPVLFPAMRRVAQRWEGASGFFTTWQQERMLLTERDRENPWTPADANLLAWAARGLVKRHLGPDASGWLSGRGAWIVDGLAGLYEGFSPREGGAGDLDPAASWHLAAARALKDRLVPWDRLLEMDRAAADAYPKADAQLEFAGAAQAAKRVDVVAAQSVAFVAGVLATDAKQGGGARKLAALLEETYKRDRLPDLQKAVGLKPKTAFAAAEEVLGAAPAAPK